MPAAKVVIFTKPDCSFCVRAKDLFKKKGVNNFREINIASSEHMASEMVKLSNGRKTVPQIFINDKHIGGCTELYDLERQKMLDDLLWG